MVLTNVVDDDTNYHMDLIAGLAYMRPRSDSIRVLGRGHQLEDYKNSLAKLALTLFSMAELVPTSQFLNADFPDMFLIASSMAEAELPPYKWHFEGLEA
ncbi:ubiquitin-activating enzyme 1 [Actinidia rufa]|uniref:Ubiquitin-activating enzyme 1 n=1 Tax=Actinidia rufa TaxID=165716 RepID=A0A7J0FAN9_9ERIC|nr:ubiquitin-activating enzyme 1 [Actinidia rufa]